MRVTKLLNLLILLLDLHNLKGQLVIEVALLSQQSDNLAMLKDACCFVVSDNRVYYCVVHFFAKILVFAEVEKSVAIAAPSFDENV